MIYRIISEYPVYSPNNPYGIGWPITAYTVQIFKPGWCSLFDRWIDIKSFDTYKAAKEFKERLER